MFASALFFVLLSSLAAAAPSKKQYRYRSQDQRIPSQYIVNSANITLENDSDEAFATIQVQGTTPGALLVNCQNPLTTYPPPSNTLAVANLTCDGPDPKVRAQLVQNYDHRTPYVTFGVV